MGYPSPIPSSHPQSVRLSITYSVTYNNYCILPHTPRQTGSECAIGALWAGMAGVRAPRYSTPMQTGRQGVAVAPPPSLRIAIGAYLELAQPQAHDALCRNHLCLLVSTCDYLSLKSASWPAGNLGAQRGLRYGGSVWGGTPLAYSMWKCANK